MSDFIVTNRDRVAQFFRVSPTTVARWAMRGMPGEKGRWDLSEIAQWREKVLQAAADDAMGDPESGIAIPSPSLENYRSARAQIAHLDLLERMGQLVDVQKLTPIMEATAGVVRLKLEMLEREYGRAAADLVLEGLDEVDAMLARGEFQPSVEGNL